MSNVFSDADGDDITVSFSNNNQGLVNVSLEDNSLTLDYLENQSGTAIITLVGTANGETVETNFTVTVNPVDDAPVLENAIADITVDEDAPNEIINVSNVFFDADGDDIEVSFSNNNQGLVNVSLENSSLTLDYLENQSGEAIITLIGTANGETVETSFNITVNPIEENNIITDTNSSDNLTGTNSDDKITGLDGRDSITGGDGSDIFVYTSLSDGVDTIIDFEVESDQIDVSAILDNIGYVGSDPITDSYLQFTDRNGGSILRIDPDGLGSARAVTLAFVSGVPSSQLANIANFII